MFLRKEKVFSQEKLALAADLDRTYIPSIEAGKRNVSITVIEKIANQSLGQGRWSEYDPSIVETSNYVIEDEQNIYELLSIINLQMP